MKIIFGVEVKNDTTGYNMGAIMLITGGCTVSATFLAMNLVFLLRDPQYFGYEDADQVTEITSNITMYSLILSMIFSVFFGQIYDIMGRKLLILCFFLVTAVGIAVIPFLSPSLFALTLANMILQLVYRVLISNPLIPDYVKKTSYGKGVLCHYVGAAVGELLFIGVILRLTASWDLKYSFLCVSMLILTITVTLAFLIREVKP